MAKLLGRAGHWSVQMTFTDQGQLGADIRQLIPGLSTSTPSDIIAWLIANKIQETYSTGTGEIISSGKLEYGNPAVAFKPLADSSALVSRL